MRSCIQTGQETDGTLRKVIEVKEGTTKVWAGLKQRRGTVKHRDYQQWGAAGKGRRRWLELWEMRSCRREATLQQQWHLVEECNHCQTRAQREWLRSKQPYPFSPLVLYSCQCLSRAESNWKPEGKGTPMCHPQRSAWRGKEQRGE